MRLVSGRSKNRADRSRSASDHPPFNKIDAEKPGHCAPALLRGKNEAHIFDLSDFIYTVDKLYVLIDYIAES